MPISAAHSRNDIERHRSSSTRTRYASLRHEYPTTVVKNAICTDDDDGARAAAGVRIVAVVAAVRREIVHGSRAPRTDVRRPAGAVRARIAQRRPVVAGARAEGQTVRDRPAAVFRDGFQQRGRGPHPAGAQGRRGDDALASVTERVGEEPVVGNECQLRRVRVERRVHVFHVQQRVVLGFPDQRNQRSRTRRATARGKARKYQQNAGRRAHDDRGAHGQGGRSGRRSERVCQRAVRLRQCGRRRQRNHAVQRAQVV